LAEAVGVVLDDYTAQWTRLINKMLGMAWEVSR